MLKRKNGKTLFQVVLIISTKCNGIATFFGFGGHLNFKSLLSLCVFTCLLSNQVLGCMQSLRDKCTVIDDCLKNGRSTFSTVRLLVQDCNGKYDTWDRNQKWTSFILIDFSNRCIIPEGLSGATAEFYQDVFFHFFGFYPNFVLFHIELLLLHLSFFKIRLFHTFVIFESNTTHHIIFWHIIALFMYTSYN